MTFTLDLKIERSLVAAIYRIAIREADVSDRGLPESNDIRLRLED